MNRVEDELVEVTHRVQILLSEYRVDVRNLKAVIAELNDTVEHLESQLEQAMEALRYTAFYGSSVPLGMSAEDYYHGAMNDLISHAARALAPPKQEKQISTSKSKS